MVTDCRPRMKRRLGCCHALFALLSSPHPRPGTGSAARSARTAIKTSGKATNHLMMSGATNARTAGVISNRRTQTQCTAGDVANTQHGELPTRRRWRNFLGATKKQGSASITRAIAQTVVSPLAAGISESDVTDAPKPPHVTRQTSRLLRRQTKGTQQPVWWLIAKSVALSSVHCTAPKQERFAQDPAPRFEKRCLTASTTENGISPSVEITPSA